MCYCLNVLLLECVNVGMCYCLNMLMWECVNVLVDIFSTTSKRLNFHNTVQAIYGVATEREQHRLLRSAVTEDTLYQRPEGTRQRDNLAERYPNLGANRLTNLHINELTHSSINELTHSS